MVKRWHVKWDETEIPDGDYVRAIDYDKLAKAAIDLIDEADLTCHRKNEEISAVEGCPCPVCVLQRLATNSGGN